MYILFAEHFMGTTFEGFRRDLDNKNWVLLLHDQAGDLQGFSTFGLHETYHAGQALSVIYSGDTIVRPAYWGTPELPRSWIKQVLHLSRDMPKPLYWLLISSGYKTYRFLSVFYREFYPRFDAVTPEAEQALLRALAIQRFGDDFCPATDIVRFGYGSTPLREGIADITVGRMQDPHVRFFVKRNPGHVLGDELVCLTRVDWDNFSAAGRRMAR